jgi:hypothetical protein
VESLPAGRSIHSDLAVILASLSTRALKTWDFVSGKGEKLNIKRRKAMAKEFRISLPNRPGQLARLAEDLGRRGANILAVAGIGTAKPVMALVVDQEDKAREALKNLHLKFRELEILMVDVLHRPGELGIFARKLAEAKINIQSIYLLEGSVGEIKVALTVSDPDKARQVLGL